MTWAKKKDKTLYICSFYTQVNKNQRLKKIENYNIGLSSSIVVNISLADSN